MPYLCSRCKSRNTWSSSGNLCGKPCEILLGLKAASKSISNIKQDFETTPPSVFVGHHAYPNLNVGVLAPPESNERAGMLDNPEQWFGSRFTIQDVLEKRAQLINSRQQLRINADSNRNKLLEVAQEVAMAKKPFSTEISLSSRPKTRISLDSRMAPIYSVAPVRSVKETENPSISSHVEKIIDDDLKAAEQIVLLRDVAKVDQIYRILSVGLLGSESGKKLVPTRWSITATDDTISKHLISDIKDFKLIDSYQLFRSSYLGNDFLILLCPATWSFEVLETWLPGSNWYQSAKTYSDYESYFGRKTYAKNIAGGYYATRLGVTEYLHKIRRQASVLVVREVDDSYFIPLGVWVVRETARSSFDNRIATFANLEQAIGYMKRATKVKTWPAASRLLRELRQQRRLVDFAS